MTSKTLFKDRRGYTAVEFALTLPVFLLMLFGLWQIGFGLWWQFGLQHGAQMAARCMTVNKTVCGNTDSTQSYAVSQSYGLNPAKTIFSVSTPACGNQVAADYTVFPAVETICRTEFCHSYFTIPALTLHALACYAT